MNTEKEQIRNNVHELIDAITNGKWEKANQFYAKDYTLIESGNKMTWPEQRKMFQEHIHDHEIEASFRNISVSDDGTMAWCLIDEDTNYTMGDDNVHQNTLITAVWEKRDGKWKMVHFNRSVNPAEIPETMKEGMNQAV